MQQLQMIEQMIVTGAAEREKASERANAEREKVNERAHITTLAILNGQLGV